MAKSNVDDKPCFAFNSPRAAAAGKKQESLHEKRGQTRRASKKKKTNLHMLAELQCKNADTSGVSKQVGCK